MNTEFLRISELVELQNQIENGNKEALVYLLEDHIRLQEIVKEYEQAIREVSSRLVCGTNKNVAPFKTKKNEQ